MEPLKSTRGQADWIVEALLMMLADDGVLPLRHRLYQALRGWIRDGQLGGGSALPSSRSLARALGIGRNTVLGAYDQLIAEGFLLTRHGAGTFVAGLALETISKEAPASYNDAALSARGQQLAARSALARGRGGAFAPGVPALDQFPYALWQRLVMRHLRRAPQEWFNYQDQGGLPALREALCDYLRLSRSVRCTSEQIIITSGAQQGFELITRLLCDAGDTAWIEEPGYAGAQASLIGAELDVQPVSVDEHGLVPEDAPAASRPKLIYVTPSHQYPSGVTMTLDRRLELLALAEAHRAWIIEDDYDSEFRYDTRPLAALQGLNADGRVLYLGTFSKVMYPGLRLGYLVVPKTLVTPFRAVNARIYREGQYATQAALAEFIARGHFARHVRRMRDCYRQRQSCLRKVLAPVVAKGVELSAGHAGMHLLAWLPAGMDEMVLVAEGAEYGIVLRPLARHYLGRPARAGLVLGYADATLEDITRAGTWLCNRLLVMLTHNAVNQTGPN
ncbi:MocR-like pyridoxine biosynthesis transcription factor PdxR [Phytohalomonas tamaricis]|uniref:MocR-like pyridoxine biosynthesis transcription factor PdxR n=1 Tax=Phytohalomonas tamaricis TaxID=2081032 RepID=UPI000D0BCA3D|nr:PLP-dependent aminotransferase family protein [Phytohalomonas tamaricis]